MNAFALKLTAKLHNKANSAIVFELMSYQEIIQNVLQPLSFFYASRSDG